MFTKLKNTQGFTLAEVLLAVAIILVLAAIAIPSVVNAQRNMHMVELDSAANQIALAAQNQMTSMKVSGTWLAEFDRVDNRVDGGGAIRHARGLAVANDDIFCVTKSQIDDLGILPFLSIEETVLGGDYVIEFSMQTATVCGVFYSDEKSGFFDEQQDGASPAEGYCNAMTAPQARDLDSRMIGIDGFMIGYYWGTPAGATNTQALLNPVIWVDKEGKLCIENPNLDFPATQDAALEITIRHDPEADPSQKIIISGLQGGKEMLGGETYSLGISETTLKPFSNGENPMYELASRADGSEKSNTFQIDLGMLSKILGKMGVAEKEVVEGFGTGSALLVKAKVVLTDKPSVPATAKAYISWPTSLEKLNVLVTNPRITRDGASPAEKGTFNAPQVEVTTAAYESPIIEIPSQKSEEIRKIGTTSQTLIDNDRESMRQAYSGRWIGVDGQSNKEAILLAHINSYQEPFEQAHNYQIFEIWIGSTLVGSFDANSYSWMWANGYNASAGFITPLSSSKQQQASIAEDTVYLAIDPNKMAEALAAFAIGPDEKNEYSLYIRTAPSIKDVQQLISSSTFVSRILGPDISDSPYASLTSRSLMGRYISLSQEDFIYSLGASSSVASWSATQGIAEGLTAENDIYFYYGITPFNPAVGAAFSSSVGWRLAAENSSYVRDSYMAAGQNFSGDTRLASSQLAFPQLVKPSDGVDFALQNNATYLYARVLTYYDDAGERLTTPQQWIPYVGRNLDANTTNTDARLAVGTNKASNTIFTQWNTQRDGAGIAYPSEMLVADEQFSMALGKVDLFAQYTELGLGLMYVEFGKNGSIVSARGYINERVANETLYNWWGTDGTTSTIESWGYYALVPTSGDTSVLSSLTNRTLSKKGAYALDGITYDLFAVYENNASQNWGITDNQKVAQSILATLTLKKGSATVIKADYKFNPCFAGFVCNPALGGARAEAWGSASVPWEIRCADQFFGTFKNYGAGVSGGIQGYYAAQNKFSFIQTRDLDAKFMPMKNVGEGIKDGPKFDQTFIGDYDGRAFSILNFQYWIGDYVAGTNQGKGVFSSISGATLKSVTLKADSATWSISSGGTNAKFGTLVGYAENSVIQECSVTPTGAFPLITFQDSVMGGSGSAGGLVGLASNTAIQGCSIQSIQIIGNRASGDWGNDRLTMGGLVGTMNSGSIVQGSLATGMTLGTQSTVDPKWQKTALRFGGVVGYMESGTIERTYSGEKGMRFTSAAMQVVLVTKKEQPRDRVYAGTAVGWAGADIGPVVGTFSGSILWPKEKPPAHYESITAVIGYQE